MTGPRNRKYLIAAAVCYGGAFAVISFVFRGMSADERNIFLQPISLMLTLLLFTFLFVGAALVCRTVDVVRGQKRDPVGFPVIASEPMRDSSNTDVQHSANPPSS